MRDYFLELKDLQKSYQDGSGIHHILKGAELKAEKTEKIAILGNSGCGKSTLLNLIAGIDLADHGEVLFQGESLGNLSENKRTLLRRKQMGFVFQSFNLIPTLNVKENLMLPLEMNGIPNSSVIIQQMLEALSLHGREKSYPDRLSGGEQQRVAVARALIHNPSLLLADEPTGNLDADRSLELYDLIRSLSADSGCSFVIATHDPTLSDRVDRIVHLADGLVVGHDSQTDTLGDKE